MVKILLRPSPCLVKSDNDRILLEAIMQDALSSCLSCLRVVELDNVALHLWSEVTPCLIDQYTHLRGNGDSLYVSVSYTWIETHLGTMWPSPS